MTRPVLMTLALLAAVVLVAGSAAAASPKKKTPKKSPTTRYSVINGTANAASDHVILASSAFPNFTNGAVDNYYSMAQTHVDNSPFAEGRASPADTGPVGQTAAAGNFQQPQYADARWPGRDSGKAEYGNQGGPYAVAGASKYLATADASEATNGLSSPNLPAKLAVPLGFDGRLQQVLAAWKAKWQGPLDLKKPEGKLTAPTVKPPTVTVPTPVGTVTTPAVPVGGVQPTPPPVTLPVPPTPRRSSAPSTTPSRSLASFSTAPPADGESLLESSSRATVDPKTHKLVTSAESRLGRVSLGGGQIVIEGIHVSATITNGGKPSYKAAVSIASASIGGIPVTIDQDGVHIAGQGQALPYQQASDALNNALNKAGIQIFLVAPEVTKGSSCDQSGSGSGGSGGGSPTTTTSSNQSGSSSTASSCGQTGQASSSSCDQGSGGTPPIPVPLPTPSGTTSSCGQSSSCDQTSTTTGPTTTTPMPTTTTSSSQTSTTPTSSSCGQTGMSTSTGSCASTGKGSTDQSSTTSSSGSNGLFTFATTNNAAEEKVTATGVHLVFTQPASPPGVPAQHVEHILGEVSLDSLAVPAAKIPKFGLKLSSSSPSSSCLGGKFGGSGANSSSGLSSAGGSTSSGSPSGFSSGSTASQPTSASTGGALPERLASILKKKPLWVLVAFLLWQALAVGTAVSLLRWRKDGTP